MMPTYGYISGEEEILHRCITMLDKIADNEIKMMGMIKELSERIKQLEGRL